jgi:hypothetical protein
MADGFLDMPGRVFLMVLGSCGDYFIHQGSQA